MEVSKADMIVSLAGRDKGQLFFVIDTDDQFVYLADGKGRRLESPKRKSAGTSGSSLCMHPASPRKFATATRYSTANYEGNWPSSAKHSIVKTKGVN